MTRLSAEAASAQLRKVSAAWRSVSDPTRRRWEELPRPGRAVGFVLLFLFLAIVVPSGPVASFMAPQSGWSNVLSQSIGVYVLMAIGLNVVVGQAGMLDLGYVAFYAVGAYTFALIATRHGVDFWIVLPACIALAALAGLILGAPTLRLRGDYLAIVTLGFGLIISQAANNLSFDGGPQGISDIPHPPSIGHLKPFTYGVQDYKPYWYIVLTAIFVAVWVVRRLERSRVGRSWVAIREDEDAAELMGVPTYKFRLWAFAIGAAVGGGGGAFYGAQANHIEPGTFSYNVSILVVAAVVLGGSGNLFGVIIGGFIVTWLPERFRTIQDYRFLIFGLLLVVMMIVRPQGLFPSKRRQAEMAHTGEGGGMNVPLVPPVLEGE